MSIENAGIGSPSASSANINNEKLIELVKEHTFIYDKTNLYYTCKKYLREAWEDIAEQLQQPAYACQKRWRYLRDYFVRQLHKYGEPNETTTSSTDKGSPPVPRKKSPWYYFDKMSFLAPFASTRCPHGKRKAKKRGRRRTKGNIQADKVSMWSDTSTSMDIDYSIFLQDNIPAITVSNEEIADEGVAPLHFAPTRGIDENFCMNCSKGIIIPNAADCERIEIGVQTERLPRPKNSKMRQKILEAIERATAAHQHETESSVDSGGSVENDDHYRFFQSVLGSVRQIEEQHIVPLRTDIIKLIIKYQIKSYQLTDNQSNDSVASGRGSSSS